MDNVQFEAEDVSLERREGGIAVVAPEQVRQSAEERTERGEGGRRRVRSRPLQSLQHVPRPATTTSRRRIPLLCLRTSLDDTAFVSGPDQLGELSHHESGGVARLARRQRLIVAQGRRRRTRTRPRWRLRGRRREGGRGHGWRERVQQVLHDVQPDASQQCAETTVLQRQQQHPVDPSSSTSTSRALETCALLVRIGLFVTVLAFFSDATVDAVVVSTTFFVAVVQLTASAWCRCAPSQERQHLSQRHSPKPPTPLCRRSFFAGPTLFG